MDKLMRLQPHRRGLAARAMLLGLSVLIGPTDATAAPERFLPGENAAVRRAVVAVALARMQALGATVRSPAQKISLEQARALLTRTPSRYGVFISVFDARTAALIGCMGSIVPTRATLLDEVEHWTMMAWSQDPRTNPDSTDQPRSMARAKTARREDSAAPVATVIVSFVEALEPVVDARVIDSLRHGLLLRYQGREALVLPGEARTASYAYGMVLHKLGLPKQRPPEGLEAFRLHAVRFGPGRALFARGAPTGG